MMLEIIKKNFFYILVGIFILCGFLLRLKCLLDNPSFYFDESALGYNVLTLSYKDFFGPLHLQQVAPPFFLVASKLFISIFHPSDLKLRFLPFVCGNLSMIVFFFAIKSFLKNKLAILTGVILFSFNLSLIRYSVEFKPYILEVLAMCITLYFIFKFDYKINYKKLLFIAFGFAIIPWFAFISAVFIPIAFLVKFSKKNFKKWLALVVPTMFSLTILAVYYVNIKSFYSEFMNGYYKDAYIYLNDVFLKIHTAFQFQFFIEEKLLFAESPFIKVATWFIIAIFIFGLISSFFLKSKNKKTFLMFSLTTFIIALLLSYLKIYPYWNRFTIYLIPIFVIIMSALVEKLQNIKLYIITGIVFVLLSLYSVYASDQILSYQFRKISCSREFMQYFYKNISPEETIFIERLSVPDFLYYYQYYPLKNTILSDYEIRKNRILYKIYATKEKSWVFPNIKNYWVYSPWKELKTKANFDKLIYTNYLRCLYNVGCVFYVKDFKK